MKYNLIYRILNLYSPHRHQTPALHYLTPPASESRMLNLLNTEIRIADWTLITVTQKNNNGLE